MPFPSPGDLPDPGIKPRSPALQADALTSEPPGKPSSLQRGMFKVNNIMGLGRKYPRCIIVHVFFTYIQKLVFLNLNKQISANTSIHL